MARRRHVALAPLVVAVALAGVAAPAAGAKSCKRVRNVLPTGIHNRDAVGIRAVNTSCRVARSLPRRVILHFRYGDLNPMRYGKSALGLSAWDCRPASADENAQARRGDPVICTSGPRRVSWRLSR